MRRLLVRIFTDDLTEKLLNEVRTAIHLTAYVLIGAAVVKFVIWIATAF